VNDCEYTLRYRLYFLDIATLTATAAAAAAAAAVVADF